MKVALVVPSEKNKNFNELCIPFSLLSIAAYLRNEIPDVEIKVFDGLTGCNVDEELFKFQPDIVGVTASTPLITTAYLLGDSLRKNRSDILTVIGGVHASALPEEALKHFDIVVVGEGEKAFTQIVIDYSKSKKVMYFRGVILQGEAISDLNKLPQLAYDLIDLPKYFQGKQINFQRLHLKEPIMQIMTSRGCVGRCPYCYNSVAKPKLRFLSPQRVINELVFLHETYGVTDFFIHDDEFLADKKRFVEICQLAKEQHVTEWFRFVCQTRAQSLHNLDVVKALKELGCKGCLVGFESHNQRNLNYMKCCSTTLQDQIKAVENADVVGLPLFGSFILGSPEETIEEMEDTLDWMLQIKHDVGFGLLMPFPGTVVFNDYVEKFGGNLDYSKMVMTNKLSASTFMVDAVIDREEFSQFLARASSLLRIKKRIVDRGLFGVLIFHVFWITLLRYPSWVVKVVRYHS